MELLRPRHITDPLKLDSEGRFAPEWHIFREGPATFRKTSLALVNQGVTPAGPQGDLNVASAYAEHCSQTWPCYAQGGAGGLMRKAGSNSFRVFITVVALLKTGDEETKSNFIQMVWVFSSISYPFSAHARGVGSLRPWCPSRQNLKRLTDHQK